MTRLLTCVMALVWLTAWQTAAQQPIPDVNDGNALRRECAAAVNAADNGPGTEADPLAQGNDMGQCLGLVTGVWHTHMLMVDDFGSSEVFCPRETISAGQMARIVDRYLDEHRADLHMWDTVLILHAFVDAYPCN